MSIQSISGSGASMQPLQPREAQVARGLPTERSGTTGAAQGVESRPESQQSGVAEGVPKVPNAGELQKALEEVAKAVAPMAQSLQFSLDNDSGKTVVKVMDTETNEVIRQIPTEEVLAISKAVDKLKGLLLTQQA